jgi:hypothetical protein
VCNEGGRNAGTRSEERKERHISTADGQNAFTVPVFSEQEVTERAEKRRRLGLIGGLLFATRMDPL